jgi:1-acyl-sn-glycerol-3-phosphate acyltransferase
MTESSPSRSGFRITLSSLRSMMILVPLIYTYTMVMGTLSLLSSLFDRSGRVQHWFARAWSWLILRTCLLRVRVVNGQRIDVSRPHVFAANHISALDIPVLFDNLPTQFRIIAKKELFRYPFLGWHLRRSGQLPIDQENTSSSIRSLRKAAETLRQNMPLVIFPEGGRSNTGQIQPFMSGAFYIAIKGQVDVVPIAIVGTYEVLPMHHFHIKPGPVELVVGEPISTAGMGLHDIGTLAARVQRAIEDMYYSRSKVPDPRRAAATSTGE